MKFEVIVNKSIVAAIERVIIDELGEVSIHITTKNKERYIIDVDYNISDEQRIILENSIKEIFDSKGLVVSFKVL